LLEGSTPPLERGPPCSRPKHPFGRGPLRSRAPTRALPALLPPLQAFNALTPQDAHHDSNTPENHAPVLFRQLPRGNPSPPLCSTMRQGRCQLRDTVPPTPVRLTRRALEGGGGTLECLSCADAGPHRDIRPAGSVIPVVVSPVRPSPPQLHHAGRCGDIPTLLGTRRQDIATTATVPRTGPRQRHPQTGPLQWPVNQPLRRRPRSRSCTSTGRTTTPQQEWDSPGRPSAPQHCSPYLHT
jgi:hypothetical protein